MKRRNVLVALGVVTIVACAGAAFAQDEAEEFTIFGERLIDLHMASAHFPIALLMSSAFFDVVGFWLRRADLRATAFWTHMLGVVSSVVTIFFGTIGHPFITDFGYFGNPLNPPAEELAAKTVQHQWIGILSLVIFGLLAWWRIGRRNRFVPLERYAYGIAMVAGVAVVGLAGYLGSKIGL